MDDLIANFSKLDLDDLDTIEIVSWNMGGSSNAGHTAARKSILYRFLQRTKHKTAVYLFQEPSWAHLLHRIAEGIYVNHPNLSSAIPANFQHFPDFLQNLANTQPNAHAACVTNDRKIATENINNLIWNNLPVNGYEFARLEIQPRLCCVRIAKVNTNNWTLCICSWHGRYKISKEEKIAIFNELLHLLTWIRVALNIPVLLGGDFNLQYSDVGQRITALNTHIEQHSQKWRLL